MRVVLAFNLAGRFTHHARTGIVDQQVAPLQVFDKHGVRCAGHYGAQQFLVAVGLGLRLATQLAEEADRSAIQNECRQRHGVAIVDDLKAIGQLCRGVYAYGGHCGGQQTRQ